MNRLIRLLTLALTVFSLGVFAATSGKPTEAAEIDIVVPLTGLEEVPAVFGPGFGIARLTLDDATGRLEFSVTVSGISPDQVTAAHIHRGAFGVNGPIIHFLSPTGFTTVSGVVQLSEADMRDLRAGNLYINVHSVDHPGGFARGQIWLNPADAIGAALNQAYNAFNSGNADLFLGRVTDSGLEDVFGFPSREVAEQEIGDILGSVELSIRDLRLVSFSGETAVAEVDTELGAVLDRTRDTFVIDAGAWKLAGEEQIETPIPSGVRAVDLDTTEFAFIFDEGAVAAGNFAFAIDNIGRQPHEVILARIPASLDLEGFLSEAGDGPPPPGFEFLAQVGPFDPGAGPNMVFTQPLQAGRYALLCFIEDPASGLPHAALGMFADFTVGGATGIRPPSTGDGGLLGAQGSLVPLLALASAAVFGLSTVALTLRARAA